MTSTALAAIVFAVAAARAIGAQQQQIRGLVRDTTTGAPVAGAVISLLGDSGTATARTIADGSGHFHIARPVTATTLQVQRIGFRARRIALPQPATASDVVTIVVNVFPVPTLLEAVSVEGRSACPASADQAQALALWEQARAALLASVIARQASPAQVQMLVYDRELDRGGHPVVQTVRARSTTSMRPFSPARTPSDFAMSGYVSDQPPDSTGEFTRTYDAPDADVLLDESFASTHCFHIAKSNRARSGQLGLAFEPAPGRDTVVDVSGTLWVEPSPAAIESIEFTYTGLEPAAEDAGAGGSISFQTVQNGVVFIDRWRLRMPILKPRFAPRTPPTAVLRVPRRSNRDVRVSQIVEHGGAVASAAWLDGVRWTASLSAVRGRVLSGDDRTPMANAVVRLEGTERSATTDANGNFVFDRVFAGPYDVQVSDSSLAAFGAARSATEHIVVGDSATVDTKLVLASRDRAIEQVCGRRLRQDRGALIVNLANTVNLQNVPTPDRPDYVVQWSDERGTVFRAGHMSVLGDAAACDVPLDQHIRVAVRGGGAAIDSTLLIPADRVAVVTARLAASNTTSNTASNTARGMTTPGNGRSVAASTNATSVLVVRVAESRGAGVDTNSSAVGDVEVAVPDAKVSARTDSNGVAVLQGVTAGSHAVFVRAVGSQPVTGVVDVLAHDSVDVSLRMARTATQLSAVHVDANRPGVSARLTGFDQRRATGLGYFLTEDSIATRAPVQTTDLFARLPGVRVSNPGHAGERVHVFSSHESIMLFGNDDPRSGKPCELSVWVNGAPMDTTFDINSIPPGAIYGVEVYHTSDTPPQFSAITTFTNACGSLVIWTK